MDTAQARRAAEVVLPGFVIGLAGGVLIGLLGVVGGMAAGRALATALALGVPLGLFGAAYDGLLVTGRMMRIGTFAPAAGFWLVLFPLARYSGEMFSDLVAGRPPVLAEGIVAFLAYQAIVSLGYSVGFVFLHEQVAPLWWLRIQDRNPAAAGLIDRYSEHAALMVRQRTRRTGPAAPADMEPTAQTEPTAGTGPTAGTAPMRRRRGRPAGDGS